jgi:hypothetical protein
MGLCQSNNLITKKNITSKITINKKKFGINGLEKNME